MPRKNLEIKKKRKHSKDHGIHLKGFDGKGDGHMDGKAHFGDPRLGVLEREVEMRRRKELKRIQEVGARITAKLKAQDEAIVKKQMAKDAAEEKARQKKNAEEAKKKPKKKPGRKGLSIKRRGK